MIGNLKLGEMDCTLYAELLANIRQISLAASLSSPCDASTRVTLSADSRTVELRHGSSNYHLTLPAKAALGGTLLPVQDKQKGTTALSWRLPLDVSSLSSSHQANDDRMSWSATDLDPGSEVSCRRCGTAVVPAGSVEAWKDLPSENWAEMMEFWHCHKPEHRHNDDGEAGKADEESLAARGYGASSAISAQEGVGFVDLTTLLFAETNCQNVTVSLRHGQVFLCLAAGLLFYPTLRVLVMGGHQEGSQAGAPRLNGMDTDTNAPDRYWHLPAHAGHWLVINLPSGTGYFLWWTTTCPPPFARSFTRQECSGINGGTYINIYS